LVIYGVLLLSLCYFAGLFVGEVMGRLVGLNANVGGVGFAMLFLLLLCSRGKPSRQRNNIIILIVR